MKILLTVCFVVALAFSVSGQTQGDAAASAISRRITELTPPDKDIPDNPIILADEIRRITEELTRARRAADEYDRLIKNAIKNKEVANKTVQDITNLKCDSPPANLSSLMDQIDRVARALIDPFEEDATNPWGSASTTEIRQLPPKQQCENLQRIISDQTLIPFIDTKQKEYETLLGESKNLIAALEKRLAELGKRSQSTQNQQDIFGHLWRIIGVIGVLSIGTIFVVKLFAPELQQQWVASGQVIQFVTVMILLSVIMALGLASILKENTLGTLLGGIAGYVLSQGVGRAAAQAVREGLGMGTPASQQQPGPTTPSTTPAARQ